MSSGNWMNGDGLYLEFGTTKATTQDMGVYHSHEGLQYVDFGLDLTTLTTAVSILSQTTFFPPAGASAGGNSNTWIIERAELAVDTAATSGTSATLKVGLVQDDRTTVPSNYDHAIINAETTAAMATVGDRQVYIGADSVPAGSTHGGTLIGTTPAAATGPYYITAQTGTGTFTAGKVRVRIYFRAITGATITK